MEITSAQNVNIKRLLALQQKSSARRQSGLFVVEGLRELEHCISAGYEVNQLFVCPDICVCMDALSHLSSDVQTFEIPSHLYERIAYRGSTEGVIAVARSHQQTLADLHLSFNPLLVVLERVEKPGNLGAILRSADAAGVDAVLVCDPLTDLFNPNLIRASIGAVFTVPCVACTSAECIDFLQTHQIQVLTAQLQDSRPYYETDMCKPTAIVMGTEATGLTDVWRRVADAHILIPMLGKLDSLNVSVSSAILLYEAVRQRRS